MPQNRDNEGIRISGKVLDRESRCIHYHHKEDIVAIKFACCQQYYPCYKCHQQTADHPIRRWKKEAFDEKAILCGHCQYEMTIRDYLSCHAQCPSCGAAFNEGCQRHYSLYFEP